MVVLTLNCFPIDSKIEISQYNPSKKMRKRLANPQRHDMFTYK